MRRLSLSQRKLNQKGTAGQRKLIVAPSGAGKTNSIKQSIIQLIQQGKNVVVIDCGDSFDQLSQSLCEKAIFNKIETPITPFACEFKQLTVFDVENLKGNGKAMNKSMAKMVREILEWMPDAIFIEEFSQYKLSEDSILSLVSRFPNDLTVSMMTFCDVSSFPLLISEFNEISLHGNFNNYHTDIGTVQMYLKDFRPLDDMLIKRIHELTQQGGRQGHIDILTLSRSDCVSQRMHYI